MKNCFIISVVVFGATADVRPPLYEGRCTNFDRQGRGLSLQSCEAIAQEKCADVDKFSWRASNGACLCPTDNCQNIEHDPSWATYSLPPAVRTPEDRDTFFIGRCKNYEKKADGLSLESCEETARAYCSTVGKKIFSWKESTGACLCPTDVCQDTVNDPSWRTYPITRRPILFTGRCTQFDRQGRGLSLQSCAAKVREQCAGVDKFSWRESNGACSCPTDGCQDTVQDPSWVTYSLPPVARTSEIEGSSTFFTGRCKNFEKKADGLSLESCKASARVHCSAFDYFSWKESTGACLCPIDDCQDTVQDPSWKTYPLRPTLFTGRCKNFDRQGRGLSLQSCKAKAQEKCPSVDKFSWRASNGACLCPTDGCQDTVQDPSWATYSLPTAVRTPEDHGTFFKGRCKNYEKKADGLSLDSCEATARVHCSAFDYFSWKESTGACLCPADDCQDTVNDPSWRTYPLTLATERPILFTGRCKQFDRQGRGLSLESCEAKVQEKCTGVDKFSWRESNGACSCPTDGCQDTVQDPSWATYSLSLT